MVVRAYDLGRRITLIHVAGTHEPPVLYGRFDKLSGRLSPQEDVQGIDQSRGWEVRHGEPWYGSARDYGRSIKDGHTLGDKTVSLFVFMDVACRLILELIDEGE